MLVLSRKNNERIHIGTKKDYLAGKQIVITAWATDCPKISLGFEASPELVILREELVEKYLADIKNESNSG